MPSLIPKIEFKRKNKVLIELLLFQWFDQNFIVTADATSIRNPSTPNSHQYLRISINSFQSVSSFPSNFRSKISVHPGTKAMGLPWRKSKQKFESDKNLKNQLIFSFHVTYCFISWIPFRMLGNPRAIMTCMSKNNINHQTHSILMNWW